MIQPRVAKYSRRTYSEKLVAFQLLQFRSGMLNLRNFTRRGVETFSNVEGELEGHEMSITKRMKDLSIEEDRTRAETNSMVVGERGAIADKIRDEDRSGAECNSRLMVDRKSKSGVEMILHSEYVRGLIPEFLPEKITAEKWLRKIDALKTVHSWEERAVLHYAIMRLGAVSKIWFEAVEENINAMVGTSSRIE